MKILCKVTRGEKVESLHEVYAVALDEAGKIIFSAGDPNYITCIRSALKPFQASSAILSGATEKFGFIEKEIALMCSSHNGENIHVETAASMAKKLGLTTLHYECGIHAPHDKKTREKIKILNTTLTPFHNNCSGKHSGMLSLAKKLRVPLEGYTEKKHPVQQAIFKQLSKLIGHNKFYLGIDGCSAPTPFLSLKTIAKLFQKLGSGKYPELTKAYNAMAKYPYLIGGKNRFDTDFIYALKKRGICKAGGEAIRGIVLQTNKYGLVGIAIKVLDGNQRAIEVATMAVLDYLKIIKNKEKISLIQYKKKQLYNHRNIHIGDIIPKIQEHTN